MAVIGRSSSGKTTLIKELQLRGYQTLGELAREVLEERKGFSVTLEEKVIRQKEIYFRQKEIYFRQIERENKLPGTLFCDRGLTDTLAYTEYFGIDSSFIDRELLKERYSLILELEKRPFILDDIRIEKDEKEANRIYQIVLEKYLSFGYFPISVPNFCDEKERNAKVRADYIARFIANFPATLR